MVRIFTKTLALSLTVLGMISTLALAQSGSFSTSTLGLTEAKTPETVTLKDGDSYNLTAEIVKKNINGQEVKMLAYNGSIPGPILKIAQGASITVHFTNNTDVPTTLHSHGVRDDNKFDGVPDVTQKAIPVGGTFTYTLRFPDAGVFWYHAHVREDYTQPLGLYGNYLGTPSDTSYYAPVNKEVPLIVSDILLANGHIAPFDPQTVDHTLMGRFGNTMLVNGNTNDNVSVQKGDVIRVYITNTASVRPFNLAIPGAKIKLVGGDNGTYEKETFVDSVLLSPSERAIVEVLFETSGTFHLVNQTPQKTYQLGTFTVSETSTRTAYAETFYQLRTHQDTVASMDSLRQYFDKAPDKTLKLSLSMMHDQNASDSMQGMHMNMGGHSMQMGGSDTDPIEWEDTMSSMNTTSNKNMMTWKLIDTATNKENMDMNWTFKKGDVVKIRIINDANSMHPMQHPIHIHGQRFLVLDVNGVRNTNLVYKDTVLVQKGQTVDVLVAMDNPGNWVMHCHIPEHMEAAMMTEYHVN